MKPIDYELHNILGMVTIINETFFRSFQKLYPLPTGLNKTHMRTLMFIRLEGSSPMNLLSKKVDLEKGSFTPVAEKLIKMGYIEKVQSAVDKRKSLLQLTPLGHQFAMDFETKHLEHINSILSKLDENEKEMYLSAIRLVMSTSKKLLD